MATVVRYGKVHKSNTVVVYNKCYKCECRSKMIYYDEDCYNIYKFKIIKINKNCETLYKVQIIIHCKETKKKRKVKFTV